jgi:hypothetical protein
MSGPIHSKLRSFTILEGGAVREKRIVDVRAILDRPDSRSMGLHPIVLSLGGELRVSGIATGPSRIEIEELARLVEEEHALAVRAPVEPGCVGPLCAAWIGQDFARAAEDSDAPELPFERQQMTRVRGSGWFLLDVPAAVFGALDGWIRRAFALAIDRADSEIADLLAWVAPNRDETRAAQFITGDPERRRRALAWWARMESNAGRPEPSEQQLVQRIDAACDRIFIDWRQSRTKLPTMKQKPWHCIALAARCAERLAPAIDPAPGDPDGSPVSRAVRLAQQAAIRGRPASHDEVEPIRLTLLEQVHLRWQEARISDQLHPSPLHAVESALFGAERAPDDTYVDQAEIAMAQGVAEIVYPDLVWRPIPALWCHLSSLPNRAFASDRDWLASQRDEGPVHPAFFDRELWPDGEPPAWSEHVARYHARLFGRA